MTGRQRHPRAPDPLIIPCRFPSGTSKMRASQAFCGRISRALICTAQTGTALVSCSPTGAPPSGPAQSNYFSRGKRAKLRGSALLRTNYSAINLALASTPLPSRSANSLRGPGRPQLAGKASSAFRIEAKCSERAVLPPSCAHTGGMQRRSTRTLCIGETKAGTGVVKRKEVIALFEWAAPYMTRPPPCHAVRQVSCSPVFSYSISNLAPKSLAHDAKKLSVPGRHQYRLELYLRSVNPVLRTHRLGLCNGLDKPWPAC